MLLIGSGRPVDGSIAGGLGLERLHPHPARVDLLAGTRRVRVAISSPPATSSARSVSSHSRRRKVETQSSRL